MGLSFIPYLDNSPTFNRSVDGPIRLPTVDQYRTQAPWSWEGWSPDAPVKASSCDDAKQAQMEVLGILSEDGEMDSVAPGENLKISGHIFDAQIMTIEHKSIIYPGYVVLQIHICIEEV